MRHVFLCLTLVAVVAIGGRMIAQSLPTSQPNLLQIIIEDVKLGHEVDHAKTEAGWPAAYEKVNSPNYSLGLMAMTGRTEAWFLVPWDSNKAMGDSYKRENDDAVLSAELARLMRADAEHISGARIIMAAARKDLSYGQYPDIGRQRFFEVTTFRVRPGHESEFEAAGKAYAAAARRVTPDMSYRVYEVVAGMPMPTYMIFGSVVAFGDFDKSNADNNAVMKALNKDEMATMRKFATDAVLSEEVQRLRLDPAMSYVPKEVRAQDPAFWMPKKPAPVKKPTTNP